MSRLGLVAFISFVCGCAPAQSPTNDARARGAIDAALDDFHDAAAHADEARYFGHLDADSVFLGTDAKERWDKKAFETYAHPHFAKGKAWSFHATRRDVSLSADGATAWFDEDLATEKLGPARGSGVLALRSGRWVILQYNLEITIPNERFDLAKDAAGAAVVDESKPDDPLHELAWLAGTWMGEQGGERIEEAWLPPERGTMVGVGRLGGNLVISSERIESRGGKTVFVLASMPESPSNELVATTLTKAEVVFENPDRDWPTKITYRLEGNAIHIREEGGPANKVTEYTLDRAVLAR
jgi:hypothetical protein